MPPPPVLLDELVEEVLLRLPPDEPAWLVRSSAVCKPWRRILAAPRFRRRYCEFHRTPLLLGFFEWDGRFVPTSTLLPAQQLHCHGGYAVDCRHGRALFGPSVRYLGEPFDLTVFDPGMRHQHRVPSPDCFFDSFSAAVLCAAQGCDHHGCQAGHFLVALLATDDVLGITSGWLYSSETHVWSELTPNLNCSSRQDKPSILVGDALYFNIDAIVKYQIGTLSLSMIKKPIENGNGRLMTTQDGGLGFAAVVDATNLTMWSMDTGPDGAMGWLKLRVIDLNTLLPDGAFSIPTVKRWISSSPGALVAGFAEGAQVIFVSTPAGFYMVDLKSGRSRKVCCEL